MKFTSRPPTTISPASASSRPATMRRIVLLPQPDGPSRTRHSPAVMRTETCVPAPTLLKVLFSCLLRISATCLLLQRTRHRRLHEPSLEDQEDDDHGKDRHHGGGRDDTPVRHELTLERRDPHGERL